MPRVKGLYDVWNTHKDYDKVYKFLNIKESEDSYLILDDTVIEVESEAIRFYDYSRQDSNPVEEANCTTFLLDDPRNTISVEDRYCYITNYNNQFKAVLKRNTKNKKYTFMYLEAIEKGVPLCTKLIVPYEIKIGTEVIRISYINKLVFRPRDPIFLTNVYIEEEIKIPLQLTKSSLIKKLETNELVLDKLFASFKPVYDTIECPADQNYW